MGGRSSAEEISDEVIDQSRKFEVTATRGDFIRFVDGCVAVSFFEKEEESGASEGSEPYL